MATRATVLAQTHIEALNMIDLAFYKDRKIRDAWKIYHDHLYSTPPDLANPDYDVLLSRWTEKSNDLLTDLLYEMAIDLGYDFDKVHLKKGAYYPKGYGDLELEQNFIRRSLVSLFLGNKSLPIEIKSSSGDGEISSEERLRQLLIEHYEGNKPIRVILDNSKNIETKDS